MRATLARAFEAARLAADPAAAVARVLVSPEVGAALAGRRVWLLTIGKAAVAMARGAAGLDVAARLIVGPDDAGHPVPDARSERAGGAAMGFACGVSPDGVLLALISGGASALACAPRAGDTLAAKVAAVEALRARGAPIAEVNALRTARSAIKGGQLGARCAGAVVTIVVSDVVDDDPRVIGSGPTVRSRPGDVTVVAAGMATMRDAAAATLAGARALPMLVGDVGQVAATLAAEADRGGAAFLVAAGEPTLRLPASPGRGGRAQHLALLLAKRWAGRADRAALIVGTDGVDGPGPDAAAGAFVDGGTWTALGGVGDAALAAADAGTALARVGALVVTGPTGLNHADLVLIATRPPA